MDRFIEIPEFIDRAKKATVRQAEENEFENYLKKKKYEDGRRKTPRFKEQYKKYERSEKGKAVRNRRNSLFKIGKIKDFYENRPEGYHVDHIIPLGLGGKHDLENLQYLSPSENQRKSRSRITTDMKVQLMRNRFIRVL
jgi:5-methylcytosine-specific restriction endonuclease McrA